MLAIGAFLKPLLAPFAKYAMLGLVAWFLYGEIKTLVGNTLTKAKNEGITETVMKTNQETIKRLQEDVEYMRTNAAHQQSIVDQQAKVIIDAKRYKDNVQKIIAKHDTEKLMAGRPTLLDRKFNRGTATLFRLWESDTRTLVDDYHKHRESLLRSTEARTAEGGDSAGSGE